MIKNFITALLVLGNLFSARGQTSEAVFKPGKIAYYFPNQSQTGWKLSETRHFTYNRDGNVVTVITTDSTGLFDKKDSLVYTENGSIKELYKYHFDGAAEEFIPLEKMINISGTDGKPAGTLIYSWQGLWELESGAEHVRTLDQAGREETEITRMYNKGTDKWQTLSKTVTNLDSAGHKNVVTIYTADEQGNFRLFMRETYNGWFDYSKKIYKSFKQERYENSKWITETDKTVRKLNDLWEETENRQWGPTAGVYRRIFSDDNTYTELFKQHQSGWLSLMIHKKEGHLDVVTQTEFQGDFFKWIQTDENETDALGNEIRKTKTVKNASGLVTSFSEILHGIAYDERNLPITDTAIYSISQTGPYKLYNKVVYSDYIDVKTITHLETTPNQSDVIQLYPNPGNGNIKITGQVITSVSVFTASGQWVRSIQPISNSLDLTDLPGGVYYLKMTSPEAVFTEQLVLSSR